LQFNEVLQAFLVNYVLWLTKLIHNTGSELNSVDESKFRNTFFTKKVNAVRVSKSRDARVHQVEFEML